MANSRHSATIFSPSSKRPTKRTRSSITEHSFQGIASSPRGGSVTYVSGTNCHPCVGSLIILNKLQSLGRAFGSRPNARDVKCKWVARKLLNGKAFPECVSKVNWRCHKNVVARVVSQLRNRCY